MYQDLERDKSQLQDDLKELGLLNKQLMSQIEQMALDNKATISDKESVISVKEDLEIKLTRKNDEISKYKQAFVAVEADIKAKEIEIKQLKLEASNKDF